MISNGTTKATKILVYFKNEQLQQKVDSFRFEISEESDDEVTLDISEFDRNAPDLPAYQVNAEWKITFGYLGNNDVGMSKVVKYYVQDFKWRFSGELLKGTVILAEKAVSMKKDTNPGRVWKNFNVLEVIDNMAKKHELTPEWQVYDSTLAGDDMELISKTFGKDVSTYFIARYKRTQINPGVVKVETLDTKKIAEYVTKNKDKWDTMAKVLGPDPSPSQIANYMKKGPKPLNIQSALNAYASLPQGNKSDKQFVTELANREPGGPYLVDTHEDMITLKKRNFNQIPYRSYEYGGGQGDCLEFTPESKNRIKAGAAENMGFTGWDKTGKNFFAGNSNIMNSPELNTLAKWRAIYRDLAKRVPTGIFERRFAGTPVRTSGNVSNGAAADGDNTNVVTNLSSYRNITNEEVRKKLGEILETYAKTINDSANTPEAAAAYAANMRARAELEKNPASARLELDPFITTGMLLTFLNVSKKYSGNYYVVKVIHVIQPGSYAYTEVEMVTQGSNIKETENFLPAESLRANVNKAIGPKRSTKPKSNKQRQR